MRVDPNRLKRQTTGFTLWMAAITLSVVKAACLIYPTGFGKTFVAIMAIKDMNTRKPERSTIVIVPTTKLLEDWTGYVVKDKEGKRTWIPGHIEKHNLINVRVFVVNTYVNYKGWMCDLLILDEAHHYFSLNAKFFSTVIGITQYRFGMALSATLNREQKAFAASCGWGVADEISETEAEVGGWISPATVFNLGIPLSEADKEFNEKIDADFRFYFTKFLHPSVNKFTFDLMKACSIGDARYCIVRNNEGSTLGTRSGKEWRLYVARLFNWDGKDEHTYSPKNLIKYAAQGMYAMAKRKEKWQNMPSKLIYIKQILDKFHYLNAVVFSEKSDFADQVAALIPNRILAYHSNLETIAIKGEEIIVKPAVKDKKALKDAGFVIKGNKVRRKEALERFQNPDDDINTIAAVKAIDEGMDINRINLILQAAYSSTTKQDTQREGRGRRIDFEYLSKMCLCINLYMIGTQEEKWLRAKQAHKRLVRDVTTIDQISLNNTISFYAKPTETGDSSTTAEQSST